MFEAWLNLRMEFTQEEILSWPPEHIADFWENVKMFYLLLAKARARTKHHIKSIPIGRYSFTEEEYSLPIDNVLHCVED